MKKLKNPFNGDVTDEEIKSWISQFDSSEQIFIKQLLFHFRYYSSNKVFKLLKDLHNILIKDPKISPENTNFIPYGTVGKSGAAIAYFYRRQNQLSQDRFVTAENLINASLEGISSVVFLDDFICSGEDAIRLWNEIILPIKDKNKNCKFIFACIVGYESGIKHASLRTEMTIVVAELIPESEQPFRKHSVIFPNTVERNKAKSIAEKYGKKLSPKMPLGYKETQALVGFFFGTPNNTLPIFWSTRDKWQALLPHGESLRSPNLLIEPPRGLVPEAIRRDPWRWVIELEELQTFDIEIETAQEIFREFQSPSVFLVLAPIIHDLSMQNKVFSQMIARIRELKYAVHEKEPISCAIMFPGQKHLESLSDSVYVSSSKRVTIADGKEIEAFANLTDGFEGTMVIHPEGDVIGNILYQKNSKPDDKYLPERYWAAASTSKKYDALLILFAGEGKILMFYKGYRFLLHRHATWHIQSPRFDKALSKIESEHGLSHSMVSNVLRIAFNMADLGYGAFFSLGDEKSVLAIAETPKSSYVKWSSYSVQDKDKRPIIALARQDGATIVSEKGGVLQGMTVLHPPVGTKAEEEVGKGSKHDTAARVSAATKAVTIAISVDGRISIYSKGKLVFKMMG